MQAVIWCGCEIPLDEWLRSWGYFIHLRPPGISPVWKRGGRTFTEEQAIEEVRARLKACVNRAFTDDVEPLFGEKKYG
jgi:hypothetical protein